MDRFRDRRSPERGGRERYPQSSSIDSYVPPTSARASRPRSRSPGAHRMRSRTPPRTTDSYRGRPPSPPRRFDSRVDSYPLRDARPRSPRRDNTLPEPARPRSPPRRRSPPRDDRANYRPRSRSPRREERLDPYAPKFRPRSQSPRGDSGKESSATSRRSSPKPYYRRPADVAAMDDARNMSSLRSPPSRSPLGQHESPASRTRTPYRDDASANSYTRDSSSSMTGQMGSEGRGGPPPVGPAASYRESQAFASSIPTGPSSSSFAGQAHNRSGPSATQSYGRGGYGGYRGRGAGPPAPRDHPPSGRGQPGWSVAASYSRAAAGGGPTAGAPSGAPSSTMRDAGLARRGSNYGASPLSSRGPGNGTSMTTPRTQRFSQAMTGLPEIKPGGERLPPLHDTSKADRLEEEAARLRKLIDDKEIKKRQGLKEWDKLERDSANAALRSELAEEHLRSLSGDGEGMAAAF